MPIRIIANDYHNLFASANTDKSFGLSLLCYTPYQSPLKLLKSLNDFLIKINKNEIDYSGVKKEYPVGKNIYLNGKNVYLRGFGSFVVKKRAEKTARNISKNVTIKIPEHFIPSFKPSKSFVNQVKDQVK